MIDGSRAFSPAALVAGGPPVAGAASAPSVDERPLLATLQRSRPHRFENMDADPILLDGQFHTRGAERDHLESANPRSLIFDSPAMFGHRHVARSGSMAKQEAAEPAVIEQAGAALAEAEKDVKGRTENADAP